jgi:uncharacterized membrane protein
MEEDLRTMQEELPEVEAKEDTPSPEAIILEAIPDESKRKEAREAIMLIRREAFIGPIPPPKVMADYESLLPGSADRILCMAEKQQEHRMELEKQAVSSELKQNKRGQIFGFIVFLFSLGAGIVFAIKGMVALATTFLTVTMVSIIAIFVIGRREVTKDLDDKSKNQDK